MSGSHYWMKNNHFRPREPHYLTHFLPHFGFVAMYWAFTARTLVVAKFAMLQALESILQKQFAIIAQKAIMLLESAIDSNHCFYSILFTFYS